MQAAASQPIPPAPPAPITPGAPAPQAAGTSTGPEFIYRAAREKRSELQNQLERVRDQRHDLANEISNQDLTGAARTGIETQIAQLDARAVDLEKQLAQADAQVAQAAGIPGAIQPDPVVQRNDFPEEFVIVPIVFTAILLFPIAIAYARRIWKRTGTVVQAIPEAFYERFSRMEQAVDAVAIEVERISEGQRFLTKVMSENPRGIGAGAAQPVEVKAGEAQRVPR